MKKPIPFGKYVLLERVNVGGMAEVFKAKAFGVEGFERLVAVKRILPSIAEDQEFITMFIDEAKISVQLTHANIAQIFDLGKVGDSFFIAMEFVHGKDLRAIFDRARKLGESVPVPMACYTTMKVCEGLDYAHNKRDPSGRELNLVHRDVSPQNILISYDGESKIIDFGIAKAAGKAGKTQAGILKGKFGYMSPEQVRGLPLDRRSDIFAVGIVLYELLTGERLFVGESDFSTLEKVRNVEIMPPSTYNRRIPEELEQIVLKALAKDVDERYQTAMDLHDDLQSFMYTSGNFFSRKDLTSYMREAFSDDIARETAREEQYRKLDLGAANGAAKSGLDAFADLAPASSRASVSPGGGATSRPPRPPAPPVRSGAARRTMMGVGAGPPPPPRTSGAPPPPPPRPSVPTSNPAPAATGASLDMDWDDEELSTQIYDKPEDDQIAALPALDEPSSTTLEDTDDDLYGAAGPSASSAAVPGAPSPFDDLPSEPEPLPDRSAPRPSRGDPTETIAPAGDSPRGTMFGLVALASVLVLLVVAGGYYFGVHRNTPGVIQLSAEPSDAVVYLDNEPVTNASCCPFVLSNVAPGEHRVEVRRHGYRTWGSVLLVEPGETVRAPDIELAPVEGGSGERSSDRDAVAEGTGFTLDTVPSGATVYVNDRRLSDTTPVSVTDAEAGTLTVRAELENYAPWTGQIEVREGRVQELPRAVLTLRNISVRFTSEPAGARVALVRGSERRRVGETPITSRVDTSGGQWTVEIQARGFEDWSEPLDVPAGRAEHTVSATLERSSSSDRPRPRQRASTPPATRPTSAPTGRSSTPTRTRPAASAGPGTLRVNTTPWSEVYVDGRRIGNTPQMNISLPAGRHTVTLINPDFNIRERVQVTIRAGQTETLIRRLNPG